MRGMNRSRRLMAACAAACLALAVGLTGCQQASDSDARVDELEQQVQDLQKQLDEKSSSTDSAAQGSGNANASNSTAGNASATVQPDEALSSELTAAYPELGDFEARVAELETACQDVQVSTDRNANYQTFIGVKQQIDTLEHEMDTYDDNQELAAKNGALAYDEYMRIERAIDYLDDRLDYAKDGMELTLGIDD